MKIIIDTDPGHDDAMALMYVLASRSEDVLAVTTVAGNSTIQNTTRNAQYILNALGMLEIPLYSGASKPLHRPLIQAVVHGKSGLDGIDPQNDYRLTKDAPDQIIKLATEYPGAISILTLGPLTNIATAIQKDPIAMKKIKEVVIMGGAFDVPGNKNRVAEFNIFVDPEAAEIVTNFPLLKTFVPLDACNDIQVSLAEFQTVTNPELRDLLLAMNTSYIQNLTIDMQATGALMYDVLAGYYLLNRTRCKTMTTNVQIETTGTVTSGMTVIDKRPVTDGAEPNATIVTHIDRQAFVDSFIKTLNSR